MGNTPFALTYDMDAIIPTEIGLPTIRTDAILQAIVLQVEEMTYTNKRAFMRFNYPFCKFSRT